MRPFDLDLFELEKPAWREFLTTMAPAGFWAPYFSPEGFWDTRTRKNEVGAALQKGFGFGLDHVHARAAQFLRETYSHFDVYHGTRILDEHSFRTLGVLRASIDRLNAVARDLIGDSDSLTEATSKMRNSDYARNNEGRVGIWYSRRTLLLAESYSRHGSEYLGILAGRVSADARQRITSAGRPAIIRCRLPIAELTTVELELHSRLFAIAAITKLFRIVEPTSEFVGLDETSPMLERDVPPAWITIEFLDVDGDRRTKTPGQ